MITRIRGTQDILPARFAEKVDAQVERWLVVEAAAREIFHLYGFAEIRTPIIERTELFERGVGIDTDVNKEMYTFADGEGVDFAQTRIHGARGSGFITSMACSTSPA